MQKAIRFMYVVEATIKLIADLGQEPHIRVSANKVIANAPATRIPVSVPHSHVSGGTILLKLTANSIRNYQIDLEEGYISFDATFRGVGHHIIIPVENIAYITNTLDGSDRIRLQHKHTDWNKLEKWGHDVETVIVPIEPKAVAPAPARSHLSVVK